MLLWLCREVSGIALVKPEKAATIENLLLAEAQSGKLMGKLTAAQLIQRIEQLDATATQTTLKVHFAEY